MCIRDSAQAEGFRSSETGSLKRAPPSPRRGLEKGAGNNAGSRLSEPPLAWASCLLAQKHTLVAWATTRAENPGRTSAHLACARQARLGETISAVSYTHLDVYKRQARD
ncbi:hypothetical protein DEO72_LG2g4830 [Vigna unguiculata]|uniref:Uncharacterized protein n=1 Tax=Vigna unguiculata TaxID=3917 RepID=A0A4D6L7M3_VIGUN|nr:hypothetical protein DEO72_LG2g4830 [Vigna unguiculata]